MKAGPTVVSFKISLNLSILARGIELLTYTGLCHGQVMSLKFGLICKWFIYFDLHYLTYTYSNKDLNVELWQHSFYLDDTNKSPPPVIPLENIHGHVVRQTVTISGEQVWVTVPLQRASNIYSSYMNVLIALSMATMPNMAGKLVYSAAVQQYSRYEQGGEDFQLIDQAPSGVCLC
jgi:hypothetical protein